jgi:VWFA-related protein
MPRTLRAALCALFCFCGLCGLSRAGRGENIPDSVPAASAELSLRPGATAEHYFILLFDYPAGGQRQIEEVRDAVEGWIGSRLLPGDAVAVASYYGCALEVQQDFTRDRAALSAAIADAVRGRTHEGLPAEDDAASLAARLPRGEELSRRTANFYGLLQTLADASRGIAGRKNLFVFSKGFGRSYLFEGENGPVEHAGLTDSGLLGNPIQEKYLADRRLFEPTLAALRDAQVGLYPVDLATDYRETYPLAGVMCQLAAGTGGHYFYPVTSIPALLDRVSEDERAAPRPERPERAERVASAPQQQPAAGVTEGQGKGRE